jgi:RNA polymerase sigma-70 factor, ECF subfamily
VQTRQQEIERLIQDAAGRLLVRASDTRALKPEDLSARILPSVEKYVLANDPKASTQEINSFIDGMQSDDLCLIIACERGDENAWTDLVERFTSTIRSAARSASSNEDAAEDLAQSIWAELYGIRARKDGTRVSKLAYYSGRGSLAGWLRAVVSQLAVDTYRKQSKLVQADEDSDLDRLAQDATTESRTLLNSGDQNPEEALTHRFVEADMQQALNKSVEELEAEDRLLVKLYYFDNLRLREAGALLGVHEATASRRLTRIQSDLKKRVGEILMADHGWTRSEAESAFVEVAQHLETDLEGLLAKEQLPLRNESVS